MLVIHRLCTKGTSKDLKNTIFYRTTIVLTTYLIFCGSIILESFNPNGKDSNSIYSGNILLRFVGIPLALVYLFEPYVFSVFL